MKNQLMKLQLFLFEKGSRTEHFFYDRLGNIVQNLRSKIYG